MDGDGFLEHGILTTVILPFFFFSFVQKPCYDFVSRFARD
jgi:hypothetical protein